MSDNPLPQPRPSEPQPRKKYGIERPLAPEFDLMDRAPDKGDFIAAAAAYVRWRAKTRFKR